MKFKMIHENYNVADLQKSEEFYEKALGLKEDRRIEAPDGSFIIAYLKNEESDFELELTWLKEMDRPYIWETVNSTWHSAWMIMKQPMKSTKRWDVSALKTLPWAFISSRIRMVTGWRLYRPVRHLTERRRWLQRPPGDVPDRKRRIHNSPAGTCRIRGIIPWSVYNRFSS